MCSSDLDEQSLGFPVIRWHQTADMGVVPNPKRPNVFMASPLDTYDALPANASIDAYPGGIHPRYKQIVGERLAYAGLNVAYGLEEYPTSGPYPQTLQLSKNLTFGADKDLKTVSLTFDSDLQYLEDAEVSGFHFCPESTDKCDEGNTLHL